MAIPKELSINEFIKLASRVQTPIRGYPKEIIRDLDFPFMETTEEVFGLLQPHARNFGKLHPYNEFVRQFREHPAH